MSPWRRSPESSGYLLYGIETPGDKRDGGAVTGEQRGKMSFHSRRGAGDERDTSSQRSIHVGIHSVSEHKSRPPGPLAGDSHQRRNILPGFMMPSGSSAVLIARMVSTFAPCSTTR